MNELVLYEYCPLCNSRNFELVLKASCEHHARYDNSLSKIINWNQCSDCHHIFRDGYYTDEALKIVFKDTNENQIVGYNIEQQRYVSANMIEKVIGYKTDGIWLDVGFGNGSLLFTAQEYGFEPFGLDLRQQSVDEMQKYGIPAFCSDVCDIELPLPVSVISLCDVLEHIPDPKAALNKCFELLEDDGVLFISMPNYESVVWRDLDEKNLNPYWGEIEHCHNFSRSRLYSLLDEHGFKAIRYGISERYRVCMEVIAIKK